MKVRGYSQRCIQRTGETVFFLGVGGEEEEEEEEGRRKDFHVSRKTHSTHRHTHRQIDRQTRSFIVNI